MIRQLDVPIYDTNVLFLLETTTEEFTKFLDNEKNKQKIGDETIKEIFDDIADERWGGTVWRVDDNSAYICLIKEANKVSYNTHELFHLADSILKDRGVEYTENNEALAYMVGWINEQYSYILEEFNKEKGGGNE
jgi:hypothetical protein